MDICNEKTFEDIMDQCATLTHFAKVEHNGGATTSRPSRPTSHLTDMQNERSTSGEAAHLQM